MRTPTQIIKANNIDFLNGNEKAIVSIHDIEDWMESYLTEYKQQEEFNKVIEKMPEHKWLDIKTNPIPNDGEDILIKFDNDYVTNYNDKNWPFAVVTHWARL